jgi:catechol 2,3-dioxygenase-like lactoylglutathione lyase family enzyme
MLDYNFSVIQGDLNWLGSDGLARGSAVSLLPVPGVLDLCFIASQPLDDAVARLAAWNVPIVEGPVLRTGAVSTIRSVCAHDPDLNLIEIAELKA